MMIFPKSRLVFFAVPKTGSTAFETVFAADIPDAVVVAGDQKHTTVRQFENSNAKSAGELALTSMHRMAILRHPLDRLHSWFRYRRRLDSAHPNSTRNIDFDTFIEMTMQADPPPCARHVGDQWEFCRRKTGEIGIHHLFDIANLPALDAFLKDRLGRGFPRRKMNVSMADALAISPRVEQKLRAHRAKEFALYDNVVKSRGHLVTELAE